MNRQDLLVGVPEAQDVVAAIVLRVYILRSIERRTDVRVGVDLSHDSSVSLLIGIADTLRRQVHLRAHRGNFQALVCLRSIGTSMAVPGGSIVTSRCGRSSGRSPRALQPSRILYN